MYVSAPGMCLWMPKECNEFPGTRVIDVCELLYGC